MDRSQAKLYDRNLREQLNESERSHGHKMDSQLTALRQVNESIRGHTVALSTHGEVVARVAEGM